MLLHYPGLSGNIVGQVYTIPELEAHGLGILIYPLFSVDNYYSVRIICYSGEFHRMVSYSGVNLPENGQIQWAGRSVGQYCPSDTGKARIIFHVAYNFNFIKIGNSSQHSTLPQNLAVTLYRQTALLQSAPSVPIATQEISWSITSFSANVRVRTCATPTASESTIDFGMYQQGQVQFMSAGTAFAQREFTFTFVCPRKVYSSISFVVQPVYGIEPAYPGTMRVAQGSGMAQGVGVQLHVKQPIPSNPLNWDNTAFYPVAYKMGDMQYNTDIYAYYNGVYSLFLSLPDSINAWKPSEGYHLQSGEDATIERVVNFKANLIRLPGSVQPGQIKALALIHIRYN